MPAWSCSHAPAPYTWLAGPMAPPGCFARESRRRWPPLLFAGVRPNDAPVTPERTAWLQHYPELLGVELLQLVTLGWEPVTRRV